MLANPYDDDYPGPFVQAHSHIDPDHHDPCPSSLSSRKRGRLYTPLSLSGGPQSDGRPSIRRKRVRPHKKKEARKKERAEVATAARYSQPFVPTLKAPTRSEHSTNGASNAPAAPRRLQVDDPIHVPHGPAHRIVPNPSVPSCFQHFYATESSYAMTLCRDTAHWSTTHEDDISVATSEPSRLSLFDLQPPSPSRSKRSQTRLIDPPRKLVVLDLNGSLLWRTRLKTSAGSRKTFRRPYIGVLAQYLAHERTTQTMVAFSNHPGRYAVPVEWYADRGGTSGRGKGVNRKEVTILAPLDAMIWSSVQPRNVENMVDVAFGSLQAALRAVWTRSMIGLSQVAYRKCCSFQIVSGKWLTSGG